MEKLSRKQRRAEQFNHSSDSRSYHAPELNIAMFIHGEIIRAQQESLTGIHDMKVDNYFDKRLPRDSPALDTALVQCVFAPYVTHSDRSAMNRISDLVPERNY